MSAAPSFLGIRKTCGFAIRRGETCGVSASLRVYVDEFGEAANAWTAQYIAVSDARLQCIASQIMGTLARRTSGLPLATGHQASQPWLH